eukprot:1739607-Pyramimonas_sp.AAC.1
MKETQLFQQHQTLPRAALAHTTRQGQSSGSKPSPGRICRSRLKSSSLPGIWLNRPLASVRS